jgi:hypothetical protein
LEARADARATEVAPIIAELRASGVTSTYGVAKALKARRIPTALDVVGGTQVKQVLARLEVMKGATMAIGKTKRRTVHIRPRDMSTTTTTTRTSNWAAVNGRLGIARSSVHKIWAAHGLKPHLTKTFKLVLAVDEKSQIQNQKKIVAALTARSAHCHNLAALLSRGRP